MSCVSCVSYELRALPELCALRELPELCALRELRTLCALPELLMYFQDDSLVSYSVCTYFLPF